MTSTDLTWEEEIRAQSIYLKPHEVVKVKIVKVKWNPKKTPRWRIKE